jgi:hypothetical protein
MSKITVDRCDLCSTIQAPDADIFGLAVHAGPGFDFSGDVCVACIAGIRCALEKARPGSFCDRQWPDDLFRTAPTVVAAKEGGS